MVKWCTDDYDKSFWMKDNGNVCLCVTSHQSFDVIQQFLNPDVKSTIFCLILSFIFLLSNINDLITYGCFMNLLSSLKHFQPRLLWRIMKLLCLCLCHNFCVNFCVCVITFVWCVIVSWLSRLGLPSDFMCHSAEIADRVSHILLPKNVKQTGDNIVWILIKFHVRILFWNLR